MAIVHPFVFEIIQRYPHQKKTIINLNNNSDTFRTLGSDLEKCRDAHQYWSSLDSPEARLREKEYRELLENLWFEVDQYIAAHSAKPSSGDC